MKKLYYKMSNYLLQNPILTIGLGRIIGLILVFLYIVMTGCTSNPRYVEGTNLSLGAYLPLDGQLMGIEVVNYLNGCSVRSSSNQTFTVSRTYCSTNSWGWGIVNSIETTTTEVEVK